MFTKKKALVAILLAIAFTTAFYLDNKRIGQQELQQEVEQESNIATLFITVDFPEDDPGKLRLVNVAIPSENSWGAYLAEDTEGGIPIEFNPEKGTTIYVGCVYADYELMAAQTLGHWSNLTYFDLNADARPNRALEILINLPDVYEVTLWFKVIPDETKELKYWIDVTTYVEETFENSPKNGSNGCTPYIFEIDHESQIVKFKDSNKHNFTWHIDHYPNQTYLFTYRYEGGFYCAEHLTVRLRDSIATNYAGQWMICGFTGRGDYIDILIFTDTGYVMKSLSVGESFSFNHTYRYDSEEFGQMTKTNYVTVSNMGWWHFNDPDSTTVIWDKITIEEDE